MNSQEKEKREQETYESFFAGSDQQKSPLRPQTKQEWNEEDEKTFWGLTAYIPEEELKRLGITRTDILMKLKSIRPQPIQLKEAYKDGFQTARHAMALAFMKYLDENRPEGKMCLSNSECEDIEKAFLVGDWEKIERYFHKYQQNPSWSGEDEKMLSNLIGHLEVAYSPCDWLTETVAWLKHLRPSWKPSEEQMEALLWCTAHLGGADHRVLAELYEHLKML